MAIRAERAGEHERCDCQDKEYGGAKDVVHAVMPGHVARGHPLLARLQLRAAVVARQPRARKTDAGQNEQNRPNRCAAAILDHAHEPKAEREEAEAERDDAYDHDPRVLGVESGERADVFASSAIDVLNAAGDQSRHRKEDGSRNFTPAQNAPEIVRRHKLDLRTVSVGG